MKEMEENLKSFHTSGPEAKNRPIFSFAFDKRAYRHVDYKIQMRMLVALVILETGLIVLGLVYLYERFRMIVEENIYRIHQPPTPVFTALVQETGWVLLGLCVINLTALWIADSVWRRYVRSVLHGFGAMADRVADLEFYSDEELAAHHESLDMILAWRRGERERALEIRQAMDAVRQESENFDEPEVRKRLKLVLEQIQVKLPPYSRRFLGRRGPF